MGEKKRKRAAVERLSPTARVVYNFVDGANDTKLAPNPCLGCGKPLDSATATMKGERVREGCISVCWSCGHVQAFDENLRFRPLTDEEIVGVAGLPEIVAANTVRGPIHEFWKRNDGKGAAEYVIARIRKEVRNAR